MRPKPPIVFSNNCRTETSSIASAVYRHRARRPASVCSKSRYRPEWVVITLNPVAALERFWNELTR